MHPAFVKDVSSNPLILFDCDSTLSAVEGVDELARLRGEDICKQVAAMTRDAMDGRIAVEDVFRRRLEIIRPSRQDVEEVGRLYIETVEPTAREVIDKLKRRGWRVLILSGGFRQAIIPLADFLGIERVEAVDLHFDVQGNYAGFDESFPTTRSGGKPQRVRELKSELLPERVVMVGDGGTDLETKPVVDLFIGFGRYTPRANVKAGAEYFIFSLDKLTEIPL